jgi:hypothetical protein
MPLLRLILKNTCRNFLKSLPTTIFFAVLTYIGYTIFIIFLNNGYDKREFPGAGLLGLGGGAFTGLSGGVIFMLVSGLAVGLLTNAYKKGPGKAVVEFFASPAMVFSYFRQAGDLAMAGFLSGAGISLVTGSLLTGCGNIALAIGVSMLLFSRAGQVLALLVRSAWASTYGAVQGVRGNEFGLAAGHVALMGAALGFVVKSVLPRWGTGLGIAFLVVALLLAKGSGRKPAPSGGLPLLSLGVVLFACSGIAWAHDGGWKENKENFWVWVKTFGALVSLLTGLGPAAGVMFGPALVRALLDMADGLPPELTEEKPKPEPPETRQQPQPDLPPLMDPETGRPLTVQDGRYEGGKPGQVWYQGQWMDRAAAERLIAEKEAEWERDRRRWYDERTGEWEQRVKQQREREGYVYDREKDAYIPGAHHPDVIEERRREQAERLDDFIGKNVKDLTRQDFLQELVDRVRRNGGDMDALRGAITDNTVGAEQQLSMGESESSLAEADAWRESADYAVEVRNWSQRANRAIGHFVPGSGQIITMLQGGAAGAVEGYEEGGLRGALTTSCSAIPASPARVWRFAMPVVPNTHGTRTATPSPRWTVSSAGSGIPRWTSMTRGSTTIVTRRRRASATTWTWALMPGMQRMMRRVCGRRCAVRARGMFMEIRMRNRRGAGSRRQENRRMARDVLATPPNWAATTRERNHRCVRMGGGWETRTRTASTTSISTTRPIP